jgi:hypothetical protein
MLDEPIIAYDGTCGFCEYVVTRLSARWRLPGTPIPWQQLELSKFGLTREDAEAQMWYISGGVPSGGCRAFGAWLRAGRPPAAALGKLIDAPVVSWLGQKAYTFIAARRHKIRGPWRGSCQVR